MIGVYKRLLIYGLSLLTVVLALYFISGYLTIDSGLGTTHMKHERLVNSGKGKVILVGGSNLLYGVNSEYLEKLIQRPVVNMGLQGSIGLRYMLNEIKPYVSPGDIVILLPEYGHYYRLDLDGDKALYRLLSKKVDGVKNLTGSQIYNSYSDVGPVIKDNFQYLLLLSIMKARNTPTMRDETTIRGDFIGHRGKASVFNPKNYSIPDPMVINREIGTLISEFRIWAESRGTHFFVGFSPIAQSTSNITKLAQIEDYLKELVDTNVVGSISNYSLPDSSFYDTNHHLIYNMRDWRSEQLYKDLSSNPISDQIINNE